MKDIAWFKDIKKEDKLLSNEQLDLTKIIPKYIFTKNGKRYPFYISYAGKQVLISKAKKKHSQDYIKKYIKVPKNKICLWYYWFAGKNQNQSKNNGIRFNYLITNRYIILDKLTLKALGLLQAEMTKSNGLLSSIIFVNSQPELINIIMKFFEKYYHIKKINWAWNISFNYKLKNEEVRKETNLREKLATKFWEKSCKLHNNKKLINFIYYTGNKKYTRMSPNTKKYGSVRILYSNLLLNRLILNILNSIKKVIQNNNLIVFYLQGLFAGEGDIKLTSSGSIDSVRLGCTNLKEKKYYIKLLKRLQIKSKLEENYICVNNRKNFIKMYKLGLLKLHQQRYKKFLNGFLKFRYNPTQNYLKEQLINIKKEIYKKVLNEQFHKVV